jgi:hypothetical protein
MTIPDDRIITVPALRKTLGLPARRPDGVRDVLGVPCELGDPVPPRDSWRLALGDWPEIWQSSPGTGPVFLVMLEGPASPYFVATVEEIPSHLWGCDPDSPPERRVVPVRGTAYAATARLAGCQVRTDLVFGWDHTEERYAFL